MAAGFWAGPVVGAGRVAVADPDLAPVARPDPAGAPGAVAVVVAAG